MLGDVNHRYFSLLVLQAPPKWSADIVKICSKPVPNKIREIKNPLTLAGSKDIRSELRGTRLRHQLTDIVSASVLMSVLHQELKRGRGNTLFQVKFDLPGTDVTGEGALDL